MASRLAGLAPARRRLLLVVVGVALVALVAVTAVVSVRLLDDVDAADQSAAGPVLLVPGYGGSVESLTGLAAALEDSGRDVTVVELAGDGRGDLAEQADVLGSAVDDALAGTGDLSVDVVGYSAGGVVARLWVRDKGGDELARRVVTLGSPHHGTDLAGVGVELGCPVACEQLAPGSDLLRALNAGDETPEGPAWVSVWTTDDETVTPPDSAALEGAVDVVLQEVCPGVEVSHGDLPDSAVVQEVALQALSGDPLTSPPSIPC